MTIPFVYRIVEVETGKLYVGVKTANNCEPAMLGRRTNGYWTSSKEIAPLWKDNPNSFKIIDLIPVFCKDAALELEEFILEEADVVNNQNYLNKAIGGKSFSTTGQKLSLKHRQAISLRHAGKIISEAHKKAIADANSGKELMPEHREAIGASLGGNKNAARRYLFVSPTGEAHIVEGLREFIIEHNLPDRNTVVKFIGTGVIPKPNQSRGERRDNLTGWKIEYEI